MFTASELGEINPAMVKVGPKIWSKLESTIDEIPCPRCRSTGEIGVKALHDLVNLKLGKQPFDPDNLHKFSKYVTAADAVARGELPRQKLLELMANNVNSTEDGDKPCSSCSLSTSDHKPHSNESKGNNMDWLVMAGAALLIGGVVLYTLRPTTTTIPPS